MAVDNDIIAAVRSALAAYLRAYLTPLLGLDISTGKSLLTVRENWPTPQQKLSEYDVTLLSTGEMDDWYLFVPVVDEVIPQATPNGLVTYAYGYIEGLQLELDCYSSTPAKRNELSRLVRLALNRPPAQTITGAPVPTQLYLDHAPGLVLKVPTFFDTLCTFDFAPTGTPTENSEAAQTGEWRSHWRGKASLDLRDQQAFTLIKRIGLTVKADGVADPTRYIP